MKIPNLENPNPKKIPNLKIRNSKNNTGTGAAHSLSSPVAVHCHPSKHVTARWFASTGIGADFFEIWIFRDSEFFWDCQASRFARKGFRDLKFCH
ncbi:hypothetical protein AW736_14285 [Termitidicoccus mucosus]|uniref:Uncharacterized protein n=1 Tax=Termitidicoccus mucosus TaxID=1184151 RepID=A0A178IIY2_9BACT|nr:hypothetical protein AW736_14285 [Opitutaceae bacterium TSB47]